MTLRFLPTILFPIALLIPLAPLVSDSSAQEIDQGVKMALQRNYSNWKRAMITKDLRGWKAHTSSYRQVMMRNLIVSKRMDWPRSLFAVPLHPPETELLKLVEATSVNHVGRLTYYGRIDFRVTESRIPESLLMLYFRKDKAGWRFDRTRYFNLKGNPRVKTMAESGNFTFLKEPDFKISGDAPPVPPLCAKPLYVGRIKIVSLGYRTTAKLNAFHHTVVDDTLSNEIIIGGLRKGPNNLKLKIEGTGGTDPKTASPDRRLEVSVFVTSKNKKRPSIRVFHFDPGDKIQKEYELLVPVTAGSLRGKR